LQVQSQLKFENTKFEALTGMRMRRRLEGKDGKGQVKRRAE